MRKFFFIVFVVLLGLNTYSQTTNLVRNNSFESYDLYWKKKGNVSCFAPNYSFSYWDWFNTTNHNTISLSAGVPDNYFGTQSPSDGAKYIGIWCERQNNGFSNSGMSYGSIGIELTSSLQKDVEYLIRFKISKMDKSTKNANYQVDLAKSISGDNSCPFFGSTTIRNADISNTSSWDEINISFTPDENGYKYLFFSADNWFMVFTSNLAGFY